jgi:hypothetical protein
MYLARLAKGPSKAPSQLTNHLSTASFLLATRMPLFQFPNNQACAHMYAYHGEEYAVSTNIVHHATISSSIILKITPLWLLALQYLSISRIMCSRYPTKWLKARIFPFLRHIQMKWTGKCCQNDQLRSLMIIGLSMTGLGDDVVGIQVVALNLDRLSAWFSTFSYNLLDLDLYKSNVTRIFIYSSEANARQGLQPRSSHP